MSAHVEVIYENHTETCGKCIEIAKTKMEFAKYLRH